MIAKVPSSFHIYETILVLYFLQFIFSSIPSILYL